MTKNIDAVTINQPKKEKNMRQSAKAANKETMQLILLIVANTLDPHIGKACKLDILNAQKTFKGLAKELKIAKKDIVIKGKNYSKENVVATIEALEPGINDIVVFYYTGHGFRFDKEKKLKFPQLDLQSHPATNKMADIKKNTQNLVEIYDQLIKKGARLNIVIGDCCNTDVKFKKLFLSNRTQLPKLAWPKIVNNKMCKILFYHTKTSIVMAAADEEQLAITDEDRGSIFTLNLMHTLHEVLASGEFETEELPWHKMLEKTKAKTFSQSKTFDIGDGTSGHQEPIFDIHAQK